jgi:hypothetical protein
MNSPPILNANGFAPAVAFQLSPLVESLGWTLLHFLWQGLAAGALLWLFLALAQTAAAQIRYLAACATLIHENAGASPP